MTNEERKEIYMNRNIKLSPSLIALSWDVIFVWTISTLYFTQVKGLTNSQVISLDSILMIFGFIMCVPINKLFQDMSPIKATRIGLLGYIGYLILCIVGKNYFTFILAQPFLAFGYALLGVKANGVLTQSLSVVKRDKDYQRVYGQGISIVYVIETVGAILVTYIYNWKPFMVYIASLLVVLMCFGLTFLFKEPTKFMDKNVDVESKIASQNIKKPDSMKKILKSTFFILLLIYAFIIRGVLSISGSGFKIYLNELIAVGAIPMWSYGYIYAGSRIIIALVSKYQFKFNLKFGVRTLIIINALVLSCFIGIGTIYLINPHSMISIVAIVILSYVLCALRMPNTIFVNNYLQVCTTKRNIEKAHSLRIMIEYLGYALCSFIYASLLSTFGDNFGLTSLVYIGIFGIPLIISMGLFIKALIKKYAQKYTVIKDEYTID